MGDEEKVAKDPSYQNRVMEAMGMGCRQNAKGHLQFMITRLRKRADNLQTIYNALPETPGPELDAALWEVFTGIQY